MHFGFFNTLFPPPRYLLRPAVGLDLSDRSVKFAALDLSHRRLGLNRFGERLVPPGLIEAGEIKNKKELEKLLTSLRTEIGNPWIAISLPEEQAFVVGLELPEMRLRDLPTGIEFQLEENIPLPVTEVIFDYEIIKAPSVSHGRYQLAVSVIPKRVAGAYLEVFSAAGFRVLGFELEAQSLARSLIQLGDRRTFVIVDFGKTRTSFVVVNGGAAVFTATKGAIGGEGVSHSIKKSLNISFEAAEQLKVERGLIHSKEDPRLLGALLPMVSALKDELKQICLYWQTHNREPIERVVVSGGQATLPGLTDYLEAGLELPVALGDVWTNLTSPRQGVPALSFNQSQRFATAFGLALRAFVHD